MRYITVPYTVALLNLRTEYKIDLYKIWKNQSLSEKFKTILFNLMKKVESFINNNAPGSLYGEWAKKEECWIAIKKNTFDINFEELKSDFCDSKIPIRKSLTDDDVNLRVINQEIKLIKSISTKNWKIIERWGSKTGQLSQYLQNIALNISASIKNNKNISDNMRKKGILIIETIVHEAPELMESKPSDNINSSDNIKAKMGSDNEATSTIDP